MQQELLTLLQKYLDGSATPEETRFVELYYASFEERPGYFTALPEQEQSAIKAALFESIQANKVNAKVVPLYKRWYRVAAAAAVVLFAVGIYWFSLHQKQITQPPVAIVKDLLPGSNKAILTVEGGKQIVLTDAKNGKLTESATKTADGKLVYENSTAVTYNTLTTPRGGQYYLQLADGTKVWLNAASSITFPTAFTGKERVVTITGEAYFEVVHNEKQPFYVKANGAEITDIGTAFNINAYTDEEGLKTTLIEGAVSVNGTMLAPGQQANAQNGKITVNSHADIEQAVAWKNGYFSFSHTSLPEVMKQLARWYDVEIEYQGTVPSKTFGGEILRNTNASQVLQILEASGVHFRIVEKKIIVLP